MKLLRLVALCVGLFGFVGAGLAQEARVSFGALKVDSTLPVEVTADALDVNQETGEAIFSGNVLISQGAMRLSAPRVVVIYSADASAISRMEATGGVTLVSGPDAAEAQRADYSIDSGTIVMTGDVLLTQGPSALTSDRMTVNLATGSAQMVGRVKTILQSGGQQ